MNPISFPVQPGVIEDVHTLSGAGLARKTDVCQDPSRVRKNVFTQTARLFLLILNGVESA